MITPGHLLKNGVAKSASMNVLSTCTGEYNKQHSGRVSEMNEGRAGAHFSREHQKVTGEISVQPSLVAPCRFF